jgi:FkbM family methyltransferase
MKIDLRSPTEADTLWTGDYDKPLLTLLKRCIRPGDTVADIGANVGLVTIALGAHLRRSDIDGRLLAFEPVPTNFQRLAENIVANGLDNHVRAYEYGLGDAAEDVQIVLENRGGASTGNAYVFNGSADRDAGQQFTIRLRRLDDEAQSVGIDRLNVIKVDIEGAEVMFLRGAMSTITLYRPVILGEFNAYFMKKFGDSILEAEKLLNPLGYRPFLMSRRGLTPTLQAIDGLRDGMENVAFLPGDRLDIANGLE